MIFRVATRGRAGVEEDCSFFVVFVVVVPALVDGVAWQFDALAAGFARGADRAALLRWRLTPADLAELVGGEGGAAAYGLDGAQRRRRDVEAQRRASRRVL